MKVLAFIAIAFMVMGSSANVDAMPHKFKTKQHTIHRVYCKAKTKTFCEIRKGNKVRCYKAKIVNKGHKIVTKYHKVRKGKCRR